MTGWIVPTEPSHLPTREPSEDMVNTGEEGRLFAYGTMLYLVGATRVRAINPATKQFVPAMDFIPDLTLGEPRTGRVWNNVLILNQGETNLYGYDMNTNVSGTTAISRLSQYDLTPLLDRRNYHFIYKNTLLLIYRQSRDGGYRYALSNTGITPHANSRFPFTRIPNIIDADLYGNFMYFFSNWSYLIGTISDTSVNVGEREFWNDFGLSRSQFRARGGGCVTNRRVYVPSILDDDPSEDAISRKIIALSHFSIRLQPIKEIMVTDSDGHKLFAKKAWLGVPGTTPGSTVLAEFYSKEDFLPSITSFTSNLTNNVVDLDASPPATITLTFGITNSAQNRITNLNTGNNVPFTSGTSATIATPQEKTNFSLVCTNNVGSTSRKLTINVYDDPVITSLSVSYVSNPFSVHTTNVYLSFTVTGQPQCTLSADQGIGVISPHLYNVASNGTITGRIVKTYAGPRSFTITLTAYNVQANNQRVTVTRSVQVIIS